MLCRAQFCRSKRVINTNVSALNKVIISSTTPYHELPGLSPRRFHGPQCLSPYLNHACRNRDDYQYPQTLPFLLIIGFALFKLPPTTSIPDCNRQRCLPIPESLSTKLSSPQSPYIVGYIDSALHKTSHTRHTRHFAEDSRRALQRQ